jgi:hypothetical protein
MIGAGVVLSLPAIFISVSSSTRQFLVFHLVMLRERSGLILFASGIILTVALGAIVL